MNDLKGVRMSELPAAALTAIVAAMALLLYTLAWLATRRASPLARFLIRFFLALVLVAPVIWMAVLHEQPKQSGSAPPSSERRDETAQRETEKARPAPTTRGFPAPGSGAPAPGTDHAPPPPPVSSSPVPPQAEETSGDWHVVPVFYGTDRAVEPNPKRLSYGSERGRRLELGRALVTVPRLHEVPKIERPFAIRIPYFDVTVYAEQEDPKQHFTMKELKALTKEEFLELVRARLAASSAFKDQAVIFVHGYNTKFDNAIFRTAQMAYDLKFDGAAFAYSWPSGGSVTSYTYDRESAGQAEPFLRDYVNLIVKETGAKSVSVVAHSMGNQPLLQVLRGLKYAAPAGVTIGEVILAAPDVDRDNFENIMREIKGLAKGITLYAASNDHALGVSRRFNGGIPRAGDVPETGPLILDGVETIDVTAASMDGLGLNHSGYAENNALLNDIGRLIQTGERPPDKRIPILERIHLGKGDYWRYPPAQR